MTKLIRIAVCIVICAAAETPMMARSTEWLVPPRYERMEFFAPELYKVSQNGKLGLIDSEGRTVLSPEYDIIYDFYEGMAVFGNYTNDGAMIKGSIGEDKKINYVSGKYYFHDEYPFYSEGFIPVIDGSGRYGYLDENCHPAFKFGKDETRPFSEGFAAVGEGDDFHWLTSMGEKIFLSLPNGSYPYGGTNFHNGIAYLWDEYGEDFFILEDTGDIRKIKPRELVVDYLYRVDSGKGSAIEYTTYQNRYDQKWKPTQKNGKWAYSDSKGNSITAFQYDQADYFYGTSARAKSGGKWGLVKIVEDDATFYTKSDKKLHIFSSKKGCNCAFKLSIPEKWRGETLLVSVKDPETGEIFDLNKKNGNEYQFSYNPDKTKATICKTFEIEVRKDDMMLWKGEENYNFAQARKLTASLNVRRKADSNNRCFVTATISNSSSVPVSTTVTLSGGGNNSRFKPQTVTITIPANSKRSVTSAFELRGVELDGWCSVSTSEGATARKKALELKPWN